MANYIALPLDKSRYLKILKDANISSKSLKRVCEADNSTLYTTNNRAILKLLKEYIPTKSRVKYLLRICSYIDEYKALIEIEKEAEKESALADIKRFSAKALESFGKAILDLKGKRLGRFLDIDLVRYGRDREIKTDIAVGDIVLVSRDNPLKSDLLATVAKIGKNYIELAFDNPPPKWALKSRVRLDLFINDVTFKRMVKNLEYLRHLKEPYRSLRDTVLGLKRASNIYLDKDEILEPKLNSSQNRAISYALASKDIFLIHGPPGTGKSTTLVSLIEILARENNHILATADSNIAVDNLLERLSKIKDLKLLRVGHIARVKEGLLDYSLNLRVTKAKEYKDILELEGQIEELKAIQSSYQKPTPSFTRGMSRDRILKLANASKAQRGLSVEIIKSMAKWIELEERIKELYSKITSIKDAIISKEIKEANVILATNSMVGSEVLENLRFDFAIIDEGSQQIEPSTLIPLLRAKRVVIAGDHKQLPPTLLSDIDTLKRSCFERLLEDKLAPFSMLQIQYRMNKTIMDFPNKLMYENKLIAHKLVANQKLNIKSNNLALNPENPFTFIDTSNIEADEELEQSSTSFKNRFEAKYIANLAKEALSSGLESNSIGIITPYLAQVKLIKTLLDGVDIEVKSVDGFQGREKELILISLVRSNIAKSIGFLDDKRRLNVAITRARAKVVMIGSRVTLEANPLFRKLFNWIEGCSRANILKL